jgi:SPP1 family phage portal protein
MAIIINRRFIPDENNPTLEVLQYAINEHKKKIERWNALDAKYKTVYDKTKDEKSDSKEYETNLAKLIVDSVTEVAFGNNISYTTDDDKDTDIDILVDLYNSDDIDIASKDTELGMDLSKYGEGIESQYVVAKTNDDGSQTGELRIEKIDPRGAFIVADETPAHEPMFAVQPMEVKALDGETSNYEIHVYCRGGIKVYDVETLDDVENAKLLEEKENLFDGEIQLYEGRNNEERIGDFEPVISDINAYNEVKSDAINDIKAHVNAFLVSYGWDVTETLDDENGDQGDGNDVAASTMNENARTEFLHNPLDGSAVDLLLSRIEKDIHKISYVPNMNDENFASNASGVAMQWKVFMLLALIATKYKYFGKMVKQRTRVTAGYLKFKDAIDIDTSKIKIGMKASLPINTAELIDTIDKARAFLPLVKLVGWIPEVDNPKEWLDMLDAQREEDMKRQQSALGLSHSDIDNDGDDGKGEDGDDNTQSNNK